MYLRLTFAFAIGMAAASAYAIFKIYYNEARRKKRPVPDVDAMHALWADALTSIQHGRCNVNQRYSNSNGQWNMTLLQIACCWGHVDAVRALLAAGADPSLDTFQGCKPMHFAVAGTRRVPAAVRIAICQMLPPEDMAARNRGHFGDTPLMTVATATLTDVTMFLWVLRHPCSNVYAQDNCGATVFHKLQWAEHAAQKQVFMDVLVAEVAAWSKRWTAARAAWVVACAKKRK